MSDRCGQECPLSGAVAQRHLRSAICDLRSTRGGGMTEVLLDERDIAQARAELESTWAPARGLWGWFTETGHMAIGLRYIVTAFCFFTIAGIEAALMRLQL